MLLFDVVCSSHSPISYALFRYALYTVVTHVSYANSVMRFIHRLRSYNFILNPVLLEMIWAMMFVT